MRAARQGAGAETTVAMSTLLDRRRAGVLLHPTSLPGSGGTGTLGDDARRFLDFLAAGGFTVWQTLPLGPVDHSRSPYQVKSAHAGNPELVDHAGLVARGWLAESERTLPVVECLQRAYARFRDSAGAGERAAFDRFVQQQRNWLLPYSLFEHHRRETGGRPWWEWPAPIRERQPAALTATLAAARDSLRSIAFEQYLFDHQWQQLRDQARARGILLFGDLPFYVDLDSVEVWWHRRFFRVDAAGQPAAVAGVPPDYFNADGQLWGNPLYDWVALEADGFRWWIDRIRSQLGRFDLLRIDHFRALESYWEVPAGATTARDGCWQPAPGATLLAALARDLGEMPLVAEDLGTITPAVRELRESFGLPGMLVLQFAFDGSAQNPYLPANHIENAVVYTGTHDNDTTLGWYASLDAGTRARVDACLASTPGDMPGALIRAAFASPAMLAVLPMQDLLGLGGEARMNVPGTPGGNWAWRFGWEQVDAALTDRCRRLAVMSGRT
ncbi:MAG: 4-alpha-glucanotransferase [Gammaproteobacteria bacterium]|nr:4-alpha-glucanotransferase [Gammaproteobacteria bacterium]